MCWIFAYRWTGHNPLRTLVHGLERLEYRGYDSAGIAVFGEGETELFKTTWRVEVLSDLVRKKQWWLSSSDVLDASSSRSVDADWSAEWSAAIDSGADSAHGGDSPYQAWIAHTRWATHGRVTEANCHPHVSNNKRFYLVHNGIIENYKKLKWDLLDEGWSFSSETDSEVIAVMIEKYWTGDLVETVQLVTTYIRGAYALLIVDRENPSHMVWVRLWSPLLFGYDSRKQDFFFSSDAQAMSGYADKLIYLEDGDIIALEDDDFSIVSWGMPVRRAIEELNQEDLAASKGSYKHFMMKEIFEQPVIISRIFKGRVDFTNYSLTADAFHGMSNLSIDQVTFIACWTSYHSGLLGSLWIQNLAEIPAQAIIASEAENIPMFIRSGSVHVFPSQSWETADSIEVLKYIKQQWWNTLGVVNVPWSTIARLTDNGLFMRAWTEIGVASTKAFIAQCVCILLGALFLWKRRWMRRSKYKAILHGLETLPMHVDAVLSQSDLIRSIAQQCIDKKRFFFLWRGYHVPVAYEAALKLKEITYLMAQWLPAGELKHWSLALIDEDTPSIFFIPSDEQFEQNLSSMHEIQARNGKIIVVSDKKIPEADRNIIIPETLPELAPLVSAVVWQLFAYHFADILWEDIDKPRNLAKSVTVK